MKAFIFLILILFPVIGFSQTSTKCNFTIECDKVFKLDFKSASNNCSEDDTAITFSKGNLTHKLDIKPAYFYEIMNVGNIASSCKSSNYKSSPIFVEKNKALLFLRSNARPGRDVISAVYFQTDTGKVIHQLEIGKYARTTFGLLKTKKGYKMQMLNGWLKDMQCDCDAAETEKWMEVSIQNNKITKRWL